MKPESHTNTPATFRMKTRYKWVLAGCAAAFALAQLANPSRKNPPVIQDFMATNPPPPEIAGWLRAACYDCHSYETRWPWYSRIAPISWLIASDVQEGRRHLNLSNWPVNRPDQAVRRLDDMSEEIDYREMPPAKYTAIHADARLTDAQRRQLTNWLDSAASRLRSVTPE
jgi:hypothetical protein